MAATACLLAVVAMPAAAADGDEVRRWTEATEAHRSRGETAARAEALARRAEAYQRLGHRQQALADLEHAMRLTEGSGGALRAAILGAAGQAYLRAGKTAEAEAALDTALTLAESSKAPRLLAAVLNDRGALLAREGRAEAALTAFERSAREAAAAGDGVGRGKALLNAARVQRNLGQRDSALRLAREAANASEPLQHGDAVATLLSAAALVRELAPSTPSPSATRGDALAMAERAASRAEHIGDPRLQADALGELAEQTLSQDLIGDARRLNERALFSAQLAGAGESVFFAQWRAARIAQRTGPADEALAAYRRALATLGRVKTDLANELWAAQESFTQRIGPAYLGMADLLLRRASATADPAAKRAALTEIQHTLESFRQVELEDYFRDDCVARYLARARGIDQVSNRTAVIYPVPLADRLELVVTIGSAIHQVSVPVPLERLEQDARSLRALLEKRTTYQYLPYARRMYDAIVRPLEPLLAAAQVDTLVLIPDRPLRAIPLAALHDGRDFVIARYAVAVAPSLTLVEPAPLKVEAANALVSGLTQAVQGFTALPHVDAELSALRGLRSAALLRDGSFTTANLERELKSRPYSIVHVASHARFEADSRRSFVLTYDGRLTIDRLEDHMKLSRFRDEPVELLFLSACQTAAGDERAALGLAGVAVKAGARSALATLWHINDQASSLLVAEFYRQLGRPGVSKAEALRRAQASLFADLRYRHPGYWSPFLLIGNWL